MLSVKNEVMMYPMKKNAGRIEPEPVEGFKKEWRETAGKLPGDAFKGKGAPVNVLGVIAKSPETFGPWLEYWVHSKLHLKLSLRIQELIILRMAFMRKSDYVWGHHTLIAKEAGITDEEIAKILEGPQAGWTELERAFLIGAEELLETSNISETTWSILRSHWNDEQLMDYMTVVTQYFFFTSVNNAFGVALETGLEGIPR